MLQFMGLQGIGHGLATEQQEVSSLKTSRKLLAVISLCLLEPLLIYALLLSDFLYCFLFSPLDC